MASRHDDHPGLGHRAGLQEVKTLLVAMILYDLSGHFACIFIDPRKMRVRWFHIFESWPRYHIFWTVYWTTALLLAVFE